MRFISTRMGRPDDAGKSASRPVSRVLSMAGSHPPLDDHSSGTSVAGRFTQPTRAAGRKSPEGRNLHATPIRFCSRWGLPCRACCQPRGALLPHRFTRAGTCPAVCFLWHCPWGFPRRALPGTVFPWSPDFPPPPPFEDCGSGHPANWRAGVRPRAPRRQQKP
jgi:hypothetical protein